MVGRIEYGYISDIFYIGIEMRLEYEHIYIFYIKCVCLFVCRPPFRYRLFRFMIAFQYNMNTWNPYSWWTSHFICAHVVCWYAHHHHRRLRSIGDYIVFKFIIGSFMIMFLLTAAMQPMQHGPTSWRDEVPTPQNRMVDRTRARPESQRA